RRSGVGYVPQEVCEPDGVEGGAGEGQFLVTPEQDFDQVGIEAAGHVAGPGLDGPNRDGLARRPAWPTSPAGSTDRRSVPERSARQSARTQVAVEAGLIGMEAMGVVLGYPRAEADRHKKLSTTSPSNR